MKLLLLLLLPLLLLTGCYTTGTHTVSRPTPPSQKVIVVYPEYYPPMYIHRRSDFWFGYRYQHNHYHYRYRR